jgi:hypothetical protein
MFKDPVCNMIVDEKTAKHISEVGGTSTTTTLPNRADAQTLTLGEPFLVEQGKTTGQKEIGPNRTEYTYLSAIIANI